MSQEVRPALLTWNWFMVLGAALIALGVIGAGSTGLRLALPLVLGPILMASGILQVLLAFFAGPWKGSGLHLMAAALDMVVGLLVLTHPEHAAADLALVLVAYLMIGGMYRVFGSLLLRLPGRGWTLAAGLVPLALGIFLWTQRPFPELWPFTLCVAADFICHGASWILSSGAVRTPPAADGQPKAPPSPLPPESPRASEEKDLDVRQLLERFQALIERDTDALEHVDAVIQQARKKRQEVYGKTEERKD
jgi:uncharacterized membrane protein HdeD (DUF308 family)